MKSRELRSNSDQAVHEQHIGKVLGAQMIGDQQMPDLVLRIAEQQRDGIQPIGFSETCTDRLEEFRERFALEQFELALLIALQQALIVRSFLDQSRNAGPQFSCFVLKIAGCHGTCALSEVRGRGPPGTRALAA